MSTGTAPRGVHSRGYLPHLDASGIPQSITFRLADSLPAARLAVLRAAAESVPEEERRHSLHRRIEQWLDGGAGACWLAQPRIGRLVRDELERFDGVRYRLHAWVVMPNHVHVLITPSSDISLSRIVHSWKGASAFAANRRLRRSGRFWAPDYFERYIRSPAHFEWVARYIFDNPVKAGLCCEGSSEWAFRWVEAQGGRDITGSSPGPIGGLKARAPGGGHGLEAIDSSPLQPTVR